MAQACKRRYDMLRDTGRCVSCTRTLPDGWDRVKCRACGQKEGIAAKERRQDRAALAARVTSLEAEIAELRATIDVVKNSRAA
jgi:hypothetical protein